MESTTYGPRPIPHASAIAVRIPAVPPFIAGNTDHKIQVHTFLCLLALLLARVVEREARQWGPTEGLSGLLELLGTVRLAMVLRPSGKQGGRSRARWQLEADPADAITFFRQIVPDRPPLVYTDASA